MFKYYLNINKYNPPKNKKDITVISVKDYYSKASIDALRAFFVIWSDVYGPMGHEPIPFEKETDARKFLEEHKGKKILKFKDINSKVIRSLDNPRIEMLLGALVLQGPSLPSQTKQIPVQ